MIYLSTRYAKNKLKPKIFNDSVEDKPMSSCISSQQLLFKKHLKKENIYFLNYWRNTNK